VFAIFGQRDDAHRQLRRRFSFNQKGIRVEQTNCVHTYASGLVLVAEPNPSLESVAFSFLLPAGGAYDPPAALGLNNFACEMVLRGAGPRDSRQLVDDLDALGVERGEGVSVEHTSYGGATVASNLLPALDIYADILRRPHLPADQIEAGRLVVIQELKSIEDDPSHKLMVELRRSHYPHPWGNPSYGDLESAAAIDIAQIRSQVARCYRPNGTILGVAGKFDWPELRDHIGQLFDDWSPVDTPAPSETPPDQRLLHIPQETNQTQIGIAYDSVAYDHEDYFSAWGAVGVLSGGMSARLFTEVREKRGLCYSVQASHHTLKNRGAVFCYAGTSSDRAQETLDVTLGELRRLADGVRIDELDRLKARIKSALIMQHESSSSRSSSIARDWYHLSRVRTLAELSDIVDRLSTEDINTFLAKCPPDDFTVVTLGPEPLETHLEVS
jgi:predicted Zn-dependent peptidase